MSRGKTYKMDFETARRVVSNARKMDDVIYITTLKKLCAVKGNDHRLSSALIDSKFCVKRESGKGLMWSYDHDDENHAAITQFMDRFNGVYEEPAEPETPNPFDPQHEFETDEEGRVLLHSPEEAILLLLKNNQYMIGNLEGIALAIGKTMAVVSRIAEELDIDIKDFEQ